MVVVKALSSLSKLGIVMFIESDISLVDDMQYEEEVEVLSLELLLLSLSMSILLELCLLGGRSIIGEVKIDFWLRYGDCAFFCCFFSFNRIELLDFFICLISKEEGVGFLMSSDFG